jgi:hypothetical protein
MHDALADFELAAVLELDIDEPARRFFTSFCQPSSLRAPLLAISQSGLTFFDGGEI